MEKALSMLHFAGLGHGFWKLALEAAVHIYNRLPKRRLKWQCPITAWMSRAESPARLQQDMSDL